MLSLARISAWIKPMAVQRLSRGVCNLTSVNSNCAMLML